MASTRVLFLQANPAWEAIAALGRFDEVRDDMIAAYEFMRDEYGPDYRFTQGVLRALIRSFRLDEDEAAAAEYSAFLVK